MTELDKKHPYFSNVSRSICTNAQNKKKNERNIKLPQFENFDHLFPLQIKHFIVILRNGD